MNKKELIASIIEKSGVKKTDAEKVLSAFEKSVIEALQKGESVILVGFGTFKVAERKERNGLNPQTKEKMVIPAKKTPKFTAGKILKDSIK